MEHLGYDLLRDDLLNPKNPTKLTNPTPVELELGLWKPLGLVRLVRLVHFYCSPPGPVVCGGKKFLSKKPWVQNVPYDVG